MAQFSEVILQELLQARKKFSRLAGFGLLFVLIGHFYVVNPYTTYKAGERILNSALTESRDGLQNLSKEYGRLEKTLDGVQIALENIRKRIRAFPDHLRRKLPEIKEAVESPRFPRQQASPNMPVMPGESFIQQQLPASSRLRSGPSIYLPPNIRNFEEGVRWYTDNWFGKIISDLIEDVIDPVIALKAGSGSVSEKDLLDRSGEAMRKIRDYVNKVTPDFWRNYDTGKVPVAEGLLRVVEESFAPFYKDLATVTDAARNRMEKKKTELEGLKTSISSSQARLKELEARLATLESPIGKIPVALPDFIKLFPAIVIILMVMITVNLARSRRLLNALTDELELKSIKEMKPSFQDAVRCWYLPPFRNRAYPLLLGFILIVLAGAYIWSACIILGEPDLFNQMSGGGKSSGRAVFMGAYVLGTAVIAVCMWFIQKRLREE